MSLADSTADTSKHFQMERLREGTTLTGRAEKEISLKPSPGVASMVLGLYLTALTIDAVRKVTALPSSALGAVYAITAAIYIVTLPGVASRNGRNHRLLPVWLILLSLWCLTVALIQHIPAEIAALGWASYVFFVPLAYVGAELTSDDRQAAQVLRVVTVGGVLVGAGAIASSILGNAAPAVLQPLVPTAGIHSFSGGAVYLAPSIFATAEEASEQLLIALFAWVALTHLDSGRFRRIPSVALGVLLLGGLLVTARRADIYVAVAGLIAVLLLGRIRTPAAAWLHGSRRTTGTRGRASAIVLATVGSAVLFHVIGTSTLTSFLVSGSAGNRIAMMFSFSGSGSLVGQGPGTSTQGLMLLGASQPIPGSSGLSYILDGRTLTTTEGSLTKTWLELGIIGVILYAAVFWTALSPALLALRRRDAVGGALTVLAIVLGVIFLKGHQSLDDPLTQPLFWLVVGGIWGRVRAGRATSEVSRTARLTE